MDLLKEINELFPIMQSLRHGFHRYTEPGFIEKRTSKIIAKELKQLNIIVITGVGKTGIVGI